MRGEFSPIWSETHAQIWQRVFAYEFTPKDVMCELYRELTKSLIRMPTVEQLADIIDDVEQSKAAFYSIKGSELRGEKAVVSFLESAHDILEDFGGDVLANEYFNLLDAFIAKFSLRYDLRRPCILCPTLPGMFASLVVQLRSLVAPDAHLNQLMGDFENSVRDLRADSSETKLKTCIQKQVNLLEAMGRAFPGVTRNTLGAICDEITTWPHEKIRDAIKNLYGFTSDYPGIRHGGTPANALRPVDIRDMIAVSVLLTGFTPYLSNTLSCQQVYEGI